MDVDLRFLWAVLAMAAASYACRLAGFLLMGYVPVTERLRAALGAIPLGVMVGIVMPTVIAGRIPELVGLVVVFAAMKGTGKDVVAALAGAAAVGVCRWVGL